MDVITSLKIKNATKLGYLEAEVGDGIDISGRMMYHRGTVQKGLAQTIKCAPEGGVLTLGKDIDMENNLQGLRIRKLTPKETWRLQAFCNCTYNEDLSEVKFDDSYFDKASAVCSNTQLYKQAGNSITVSVVQGILKNLLIDTSEYEEVTKSKQLELDILGLLD